MKKKDLTFYTLVTFFIIGVATKWILPIRIIVIVNSLLVLYFVISTLWKMYRKGNN